MKDALQEIKSVKDKKQIAKACTLYNESLGAHVMFHTVVEDAFNKKRKLFEQIRELRREGKKVQEQLK